MVNISCMVWYVYAYRLWPINTRRNKKRRHISVATRSSIPSIELRELQKQLSSIDMEKMAPETPARSNTERARKAPVPPPTFHPSLWGGFFLTYQPPTAPQVILLTTRKPFGIPFSFLFLRGNKIFIIFLSRKGEYPGLCKIFIIYE